MASNIDRNDLKANRAAGTGRPLPALLSRNHHMLLDRLTRKPANLPPVSTPAASPKIPATLSNAPVPQPVAEERRGAPRRRMLKGGVISYKGNFAGLRCTVRDLSDTGARLKICQPVHVPDSFELIIEIDGLYAKSEVVWRKGHDIGVRFTEPMRSGNKIREQVITPRETVRLR